MVILWPSRDKSQKSVLVNAPSHMLLPGIGTPIPLLHLSYLPNKAFSVFSNYTFLEAIWQHVSRAIKVFINFDPVFPLLRMHLFQGNNPKGGEKPYMLKDVHYSFKNKKQPKNPTIGEQVIKSWSTH